MLTVGVLGPLEVSVDGRPVVLTSGRLRTLVVVLAMAAGSPVPVDRLAAGLWHGELPDHVRRAVQTYLGRLRGVLGVGVIVTEPAGYRLAIDPDAVDALRFGRLLEVAAGAGDPAGERAALDEALGLWRGEPFDGVPSEWLVRYEAPRLVERRLGAIERRVDLDLAEGRHGEAVAWLQELTARYPLRESLWVRLLVALDQSGRQAEALARYEEVRRRVAEELGTDPGPALRQLHADLLSAKPPRPVGSVPAGRGRRVVPYQLPRDLDGFAGRVGALARLDGLLGAGGDGVSTPVVVAVITGTAGVGKTTLAVHWAHRVADRFPDGQLYVNLRGFDPAGAVTATEAVRGLLSALDVPLERVPAELDAQVGLYRSLLAGRRVLVLLDNARDAEQVRPLLPASPSCLVLVTSRHQLTSLVATDGARPLPVDLLTDEEAGELLAHRLGAARVAAEPVAVAQIIQRCAGLPLALAVAAAHAATRPAFALSVMAERLGDERTRLDVLTAGDPGSDARAVFSWSYHELSPAAAGLFRLLGLHCGPDLSVAAAASLAGRPVGELRPVLAELCGQHLLIEHAPGRFIFHDLLRAYAAELAGRYDSEQVRREARHRLLDHYVHTGAAAARLLNPHDPIGPGEPRPGVAPVAVADSDQALGWFATEHHSLLAAVDEAAATGFDAHAWQLAWAVRVFLNRRGYWHSQWNTQHTALAAAQRLGDRRWQAHSNRSIAAACVNLGRYEWTGVHLRRALALYRELGDVVSQGHCHLNLAQLEGRQDRPAAALRHARDALELYVAAGYRAGEALAFNGIGYSHAKLGDFRAALDHCGRALAISEELADRSGQASTWDSLGYAHHGLGHHTEAIRCYTRALERYEELGYRLPQAGTLTSLGAVHHAAGEVDAARTAWRRALAILDELDHPDAEAVRGRLKEVQ